MSDTGTCLCPLKINIKNQGAPIVNGGCVYKKGDGVVALAIDLDSKYCEVFATYSSGKLTKWLDIPGIALSATKNSLHLMKKTPRSKLTEIEFPEFLGWNVWAANVGRYTLSVCLCEITGKVKP